MIDKIEKASEVANDQILHLKLSQYKYEVMKTCGCDPLDESSREHQLFRVFKAYGIHTKIGNEIIEDFVVLKQGTDKWGLNHIKSRSHHIDTMRAFGLSNCDEVMDLVGQTLNDPYIVDLADNGNWVFYSKLKNKEGKCLCVVVNSEGSITSFYPRYPPKTKRNLNHKILVSNSI